MRRGTFPEEFSLIELPFKLIVATAWVANLNVDLFIRGHNERLSPYQSEPLLLFICLTIFACVLFFLDLAQSQF